MEVYRRMAQELVSRAAVWTLIWVVALRWLEVPRRSPARRRQAAPRTVRRSWGMAGEVRGRLFAVRLQFVLC